MINDNFLSNWIIYLSTSLANQNYPLFFGSCDQNQDQNGETSKTTMYYFVKNDLIDYLFRRNHGKVSHTVPHARLHTDPRSLLHKSQKCHPT